MPCALLTELMTSTAMPGGPRTQIVTNTVLFIVPKIEGPGPPYPLSNPSYLHCNAAELLTPRGRGCKKRRMEDSVEFNFSGVGLKKLWTVQLCSSSIQSLQDESIFVSVLHL